MPASYYYYFLLQFAPLIPLVAAVPNFKKLDPPLRVFLYFSSVTLTLAIVTTAIAFRRENTLWIVNLSQPLYLGMLLWMFQYWEKDRRLRTLILSLFIPFVLVWLFEVIPGRNMYRFTTYNEPIAGVILTFVACLTIYRLNKIFDEPITEKPPFWISAGIFLYYGTDIIITLMSKRLFEISDEMLREVLLFQVTFNFFAQILFLIAYRRKIKRYSADIGEALV